MGGCHQLTLYQWQLDALLSSQDSEDGEGR